MAKLTTFTTPPIHRGVTVSPAPRRAPLPRNAMNWKKTVKEMIWMYAAPRSATSSDAPKAVRMGFAKTMPTTIRGTESRTPRTRLCFNTWSARPLSPAPIARATRAMVPALIEIMMLENRKRNWAPRPTAATAAGASAPSPPTRIRSTVVVRVCNRFDTITGQARENTEERVSFPLRRASIRSATPTGLFVPWPGSRESSLPYDLHDDLPSARLVVEFHEDDLLPGPECRSAVRHGDREARPQERRPHVAVSIPVPPPSFVPVLEPLREQPLEGRRDVLLHEARLELVRDQRARAGRSVDASEAVRDPGLADRPVHGLRDVDRLDPGARVERNRLPIGDHGLEMSEPLNNLPRADGKKGLRGPLRRLAAPAPEA